jgi:hypothetical protein
MEGYGKYYYNNGDRYEGEFLNGIREGKGKIFYGNGDRFEGEFQRNVREGKGKIFQANGEVFEGIFRNDEPIDTTYGNNNLVDETGGLNEN